MQVTHGLVPLEGGRVALTPGIGLTIGNFDGVHRGHRAMLDRLARKTREMHVPCGVLTFEPHPREFFAPAAAPTRLTRLREKLELIAESGIDRTHVLRFGAQLAALAADRFVEDVLVRGLGMRWLLVGRDFRFGAMPDVMEAGERVSSSGVRAALAAGDLAGAARLLGRGYSMSGRVAHGEKLGRKLGFPTANIVLRRRPPLAGIFAVTAELEETHAVLRGVASVGRRPTVRENAPPLLEVHLFDWSGDIYGRHLKVQFLRKLRDEAKYDGLDALRAAIARDAQHARDYFRNHG
jgi:riboflavin kinase/FMN adenylyltransferase